MNAKNVKETAAVLAGVLCLLASVVVAADELEMSRWTIDGGGVMHSTGGAFELSGTIGQPDAGTMEAPGFTLTGGFWFPLAAGDCNTDGTVNLFDFSDLEPCLTDPDGGVSGDCACFDLDQDDDIDLADVAKFQQTFTGG